MVAGPVLDELAGVTVVGGGVAGISTVAALRRLGHRGPVTVLEEGTVPHDRPPLSKGYLRGEVDEDGLRIYPDGWFADHGVRLRSGTAAVSLAAGSTTVRLDDGTSVPADAVVLAQGATARPLPVPGGEAARTLRTLPDARRLRPLLVPGARLLVVGAGLVGAEVTSTAVALGVRVVLVDPEPLPSSAALGELVARELHEDHVRHGVRVVRAGVTSLRRDGPGTVVQLDDGSELGADVVLAATGLRPRDDLARAAGLQVAEAGGVLVDTHQRTSAPGVLAVGDGTSRRLPGGGSLPSVGHWDAARRDGETAASALLGRDVPPRGAPWFWTDRYGRHVEVSGDVTAGSRTVLRGEPGPQPFTVLGWREGVLTGAVTVDDPRTARAVRRLVDRATPVDPDRLAEPGTDLRALARG